MFATIRANAFANGPTSSAASALATALNNSSTPCVRFLVTYTDHAAVLRNKWQNGSEPIVVTAIPNWKRRKQFSRCSIEHFPGRPDDLHLHPAIWRRALSKSRYNKSNIALFNIDTIEERTCRRRCLNPQGPIACEVAMTVSAPYARHHQSNPGRTQNLSYVSHVSTSTPAA